MASFIYAFLVFVNVLCIVIPSIALKRALKNAGLAESSQQKVYSFSLFALLGWLSLTAVFALGGFFAVFAATPERILFVPLIALVTFVSISRTALLPKLLKVTPRHWPVLMQTFRVGVELSFFGIYQIGQAPIQVTFEGRNFDVLVGITAPMIAFLIRNHTLSPKKVIVWNILGLAILINTIFTVFTSIPGQLFWNHWASPFTELAQWPFIWIPGFLAPFAIFLHISSIRQNRAMIAELKSTNKG